MATDVAPPPIGAWALPEPLAAPAAEREALNRYAWPPLVRAAGYVAGGAAVLTAALGDPRHTGLYLALGAVFMASYHLFCRPRARVRPAYDGRFALMGAQLACATAIQYANGDFAGPTILFYILAAELQFLLPLRPALIGTALLWPLAVGAQMLGSKQPWTGAYLASSAAEILAGFVFVAAFTRSAVVELTQRYRATLLLEELNRAHAALNGAHEQLRRHVDSVEELAVARERNRLAREIHDTLGHYLAIINVQLETAQKLGARDPAKGQAAVATAKRLASECLAEVRRSVAALRPAALEAGTLLGAVQQLADETRRVTGLAVHVATSDEGTRAAPAPLSPAVEVTVYRAIQEALTNVRKHAAARTVWIDLGWGAEALTVDVRDDGRGAAPCVGAAGAETPVRGAQGQPGFGLRGMGERLAAAGGTLDIDTAPGAGFRVALRVPYAPVAHAAPAAPLPAGAAPERHGGETAP